MKKILVTTSSFAVESPEVLVQLKEAGLEIINNPYGRTLCEKELTHLLREYRPVGLLAGTEKIDRYTVEEASLHLRVISRVGVGWDNIDYAAAGKFGILVYRTTGVLAQAVAELTIGFILAALRKITIQDRLVRDGKWHKSMGGLLLEKTVGLVGFGEIGQWVAMLVRAFGASVIYYDPAPSHKEKECGAKGASLAELLKSSDIISLHASGRQVILTDIELSMCKKGVILINTARGSLVDEVALCRCLTEGQIGFACLDVFAAEPYTGPLAKLDNVILTPHIGSYAKEARIAMEKKAVDNLLHGLKECGLL